ncbi:hypothetical protein BIV57_09605 [Mangrovactinospora gilvigrisea]|uniref:DUF1416 domain-containing protein n=1 Tax=Mangrovactinospora gilvigrisea TaxID=1428644 RepID=A0A1J7C8F1_9ACTN|nr:DUF1416 domain-containing protein [Mangrovactinospora gilvigrisea]OIV37808.1 hypothetical protein BIV57_09605 [Mangrovactinospora gilvigrisea]
MSDSCGAPEGGRDASGVDTTTEAVIRGIITRDGQPVGGYVRLLDEGGEFTAEVPTGDAGTFTFFAAPGTWTLRALVPGATADRAVVAVRGATAEVAITV